jgi:hypothetical protein
MTEKWHLLPKNHVLVVKNWHYGIGNQKFTTIFALYDNKLTKFAGKKTRFGGQENEAAPSLHSNIPQTALVATLDTLLSELFERPSASPSPKISDFENPSDSDSGSNHVDISAVGV